MTWTLPSRVLGASLRRASLLSICVALLASACGGNKAGDAKTAADAPRTLESDPIALFPSGPIAMGRVDVRAMFAAGASGAEAINLADRYFPMGPEAGFSLSKDVDTVYVGSYALQGVDVEVVAIGRFDEAKVKRAIDQHTTLRGGAQLTATPYASRTIYSASKVSFCILSEKVAVVGTDGAVRRALDRVRDGVPARTLTGFMVDTLASEGASFAVAADLAGQSGTIRIADMKFLDFKGLKVVRVLGDFKAPGFNIAGTLTYDNDDNAKAGAQNLGRAAKFASGLAALGTPVPTLQGLDIKAEKTDVQVKFGVDDKQLKDLLVALPGVLGG
ncbi:MAG: hypothetical protein U0174_18575 [Polyangiaceae bacterium]